MVLTWKGTPSPVDDALLAYNCLPLLANLERCIGGLYKSIFFGDNYCETGSVLSPIHKGRSGVKLLLNVIW